MYIKSIKELNGCLRGQSACKFIIGTLAPENSFVMCAIGNECCKDYCCYHLDDTREDQIQEVLELLKAEEVLC